MRVQERQNVPVEPDLLEVQDHQDLPKPRRNQLIKWRKLKLVGWREG